MKKSLISLSVLATFGLLASSSSFAQAQGGQIDFNGRLTDSTCTIDGAANQTVTLPTLSTKGLSKAGEVGGATSFQIKVKDCSGALTKIAAHFESKLNMDPTHRTLKQTSTAADAAKEVQLQLLNADGSVLPVGSTGQSYVVSGGAPGIGGLPGIDTGSGTMTYAVQYYATGAATQGPVTSSTLYTLAYP
ncbi:fimbrial protein [Paraherbaspirillum soli]|uniref:Fimbrial protein n=1 Tax=Paraherbaspirillum soli TaxID=631222 RepID=A0ABW0M370_9BURK